MAQPGRQTMVTTHTFLESLSLLPGIAQVQRRASNQWNDDVPLHLELALIGKQIAERLPTFTEEQRAYLAGILKYGLMDGQHGLRPLVLRPLLSTLYERTIRIGPTHQATVMEYLIEACGADDALP